MNRKITRWFGWILIGIAVVAIGFVLISDAQVLDGESVEIPIYDDTVLAGTYYEGEMDWGVVLMAVYGSDQVTMRSVSREFQSRGFHVLTFDYRGHGQTQENINFDFDNYYLTRLQYDAEAALTEFVNLSGLSSDQVFLFGYGVGAETALAISTMLDDKPKGLVLLGIDSSEDPKSYDYAWWIDEFNDRNPETDLLLIAGRWDDIGSVEDTKALFDRLREHGGGEVGYNRDLTILQGVVNNFMPYSYKVFNETFEFLNRYVEPDVQITGGFARTRVSCWIIAVVGLFAGVWLVGGKENSEDFETGLFINDAFYFLSVKVFLWFVAIILAGILMYAVLIATQRLHLIGVVFSSLIGGYGLLHWLLYRFGKMPGIEGKLTQWRILKESSNWFLGGLIAFGLLIFTAAFAQTGLFHIFPLNDRLVLLLVFTPISAVGFWVSNMEEIVLVKSGWNSFWVYLAQQIIWLTPFLLYIILLWLNGSVSGMIGGVQGMLILLLVIGAGRLLKQYIRNGWVVAMYQAFLLYWLILPQGVLFG